DALNEPSRNLATKHVIIISDGDPQLSNTPLLAKMKRNKTTVTTVGVATHGAPYDASLESIAKGTGGRFYKVMSARQLPAIYTKEPRFVTELFLFERRFHPPLFLKGGPADNPPDPLNPL